MEQTLKLNDLLKIDVKELSKYKLHLAKSNSEDQPLDVFAKDRNEWVSWNTYRKERDDFNREYIFSLIQDYHYGDRYIFGGVFRVLERYADWKERNNTGYRIEEVEEFSPYVGRLEIGFSAIKSRGRAFCFERWVDDMVVLQIRDKSYQCIDFPGYDNVCVDFAMLEHIVKNQAQSWKVALENVKGVYVIADKSNGKKYVGSAYGEAGIWSRWSTYVHSDGHGNNDELVALIAEKGAEYAKKNFQFAILEILPMKADADTVIRRENFWKQILLTKGRFGYNKN